MKVHAYTSKLSSQLRKDLVPEVKAILPPGVDFNILYGQLLARLEQAENPSLQHAKLLLQHPEVLLKERDQKLAKRSKANQELDVLIVKANIPKAAPDRDKLVKDTLSFLGLFQKLTPAEVKRLTLLRQENGNRDPLVVPFSKVNTPEDLANNLENHLTVDGHFVLKHGEQLDNFDPVTLEIGSLA